MTVRTDLPNRIFAFEVNCLASQPCLRPPEAGLIANKQWAVHISIQAAFQKWRHHLEGYSRKTIRPHRTRADAIA